LLLEDAEGCSFCSAPDAEPSENQEPVAAGANASGEPEWRREVSRRLAAYRARRGQLSADHSQSGFSFQQASEVSEFDEEMRARRRPRPAPRPRPTERVEICIQPELDFSNAPDDRAHPQTALVPVASLAERRWAGAIDALFLALTWAGFLGLFRSLGGEITLAKTDAIVSVVTGYLFYALYLFLFTTLAGATPGMQLRGLVVVRLDGSLPDTRQLLWRSFGYLLSGATVMLGFLWALWDEDHFTWQDRISHTYITAAEPMPEAHSFNLSGGHHSLAHK